MLELSLGNLVSWAIQVAALGIAGVLLPTAFRVTSPGARHLFLRVVLVTCLVLPAVQPWVPQETNPSSSAATRPSEDAQLAEGAPTDAASGLPAATPPPSSQNAAGPRWSIEAAFVGVYAAGLLLRLAWLGLGLLSLARLRRMSALATPRPASIDDAALLVGVDAEFRISPRVVRPVTFGLRAPVVLVPPDFLHFKADEQTAVAAHELLHVARRDWIRTLGDEFLLAVLWFHPALWWLVDQIHLSVEQVVDREVVQRVGARKPYLEALLKLAAAGPTPMLQPASLFLKHGHLAQRVALLVREASMSRIRLLASFALVVAVLIGGGLYVVQAFPLRAMLDPVTLPAVPPVVTLFRMLPPPPPPPPPPSAKATPTSDQAAAGPQARPVVDPKVQQSKPGAVLAPPPPPPPPAGTGGGAYVAPQPFDPMVWEKRVQMVTVRMNAAPTDPQYPYTLGSLYWERVYRDAGLTVEQKQAFLQKGFNAIEAALKLKPDYFEAMVYKNLLLRSQATVEADPAKQQALIAQADKLRDEALKIKSARDAWSEIPPNALRADGDIGPPRKVKDVKPVYPEAAAKARVQGAVIVEAVIGTEGRVRASRILRSIPLLDRAALDAVNQWEFSPTLLNGEAVPVVMTATLNFRLKEPGVAGGVPGGVTAGVLAGDDTTPPPPPPPPPLPPGTIKVGGDILPPARLVDVRPIYPADAQEARIQGVVILEVLIGKEGKVETARVLRSIPALDQAAIDAVRQWMFTPTVLNGTPVNVVMTVTVNFTLK